MLDNEFINKVTRNTTNNIPFSSKSDENDESLDHCVQTSTSVDFSSIETVWSDEHNDSRNEIDISKNNIENDDNCESMFEYKQGRRTYVHPSAFDNIEKKMLAKFLMTLMGYACILYL